MGVRRVVTVDCDIFAGNCVRISCIWPGGVGCVHVCLQVEYICCALCVHGSLFMCTCHATMYTWPSMSNVRHVAHESHLTHGIIYTHVRYHIDIQIWRVVRHPHDLSQLQTMLRTHTLPYTSHHYININATFGNSIVDHAHSRLIRSLFFARYILCNVICTIHIVYRDAVSLVHFCVAPVFKMRRTAWNGA